MRDSYLTLTGDRIDYSSLRDAERRYLGAVMAQYRRGEAYPNFVNRVNAPGSPALAGGRWVTKAVAATPLYRICQDLSDRLGIAQGFLARSPGSSPDLGERVPKGVGMSCDEAARRIGVSGEAVRKAVRDGRLAAERVGRTYVLDPQLVDAFASRTGRAVREASSAGRDGELATIAAPKAGRRLRRLEERRARR